MLDSLVFIRVHLHSIWKHLDQLALRVAAPELTWTHFDATAFAWTLYVTLCIQVNSVALN